MLCQDSKGNTEVVMIMQAVIRFELRGLSAGLYHLFEEDGTEYGWSIVSTSTGRCTSAISFEHGRHILDGCIEEIWSRVGCQA